MLNEPMRTAVQDFHEARRRAALEDLLARLTGKSTALLSYEDVYRKLRATGSANRGMREIPLAAIVGTVGRYTDFTRTFLPRAAISPARWAGVMVANGVAGLPPIEVYQIGEAYFVRDGHHRVSVARQVGATHIEAEVIEVRTRVPLSPSVRPEELIIKAEQAEFLEKTGLGDCCPTADFSVSETGQYARLESHIEAHRYVMEAETGRELSFGEAAQRWHDDIYLPVVQTIREQGLLREFAEPGRTETDLYIWLVKHRLELQRAVGWAISPEAAAADLAARYKPRPAQALGQRILQAVVPESLKDGPAPGQWRASKLAARYSDRLFSDILVPVAGTPEAWAGLGPALRLAQLEGARLHGLHILASGEGAAEADALRAEFERHCASAGVAGTFSAEPGDITRKILERARLTDLVALTLNHPPGLQPLARLGSGLAALIHQCGRPLLVAPGPLPRGDKILLAYDGSPNGKEALFVATYLAERWPCALVVVRVGPPTPTALADEAHARAYVAWHEIPAEFVVVEQGAPEEIILRTALEQGCQLIVMGGYGASPVVTALRGDSLVDALLRATTAPLLICR